MRLAVRVLAVLLLAVLSACRSVPKSGGAGEASAEARDIGRLMDAYHREGMFNGIALVARDGEVVFEKSYGYANAEWEAVPDRHTKFRLASITKQFTALMILQMAQEGKLKLDDTISDHLAWYREDTGRRITIHHLLTHTSGIPNYSNFSGFFPAQSRATYGMRDFVEKFCSNDLESEPGERYSYCNSGYYILGAILEEIDGRPWERVVEERVARPAGMTETGAYTHTRLMPRRAVGYMRDRDGVLQPAGYQDMSIWRAAGSMYSTASDMLLWDRALREDTLLAPEWKARMFSKQQGNYGYGVNVFEVENAQGEKVRYMGHSGSYAGFNNYFAHFPDTGEVVILLNNGGSTEISAIRDGIVNILTGNAFDLPLPTFRLAAPGTDPRLVIRKMSSRGVITSDDATFRPAKAAGGTTIYAMDLVVHDGERAYGANSTGGAHLVEGRVEAEGSRLRHEGIGFSETPWLEADLAVEVTGTESPRLEAAWTLRNTGTESRSVRMLWFADTDLTTGDSSASQDRVAIVPVPGGDGAQGLLVFNHPAEGEAADAGSGLLLHVEGAPHHLLGIAGDAGASGYWRSTGPFESIGPKAAGYRIPEELRGTVQNDADGDGVTDGPRDVGTSVEVDVDLPAGGEKTVRFVVDFGPGVKIQHGGTEARRTE